MNGLNLLPALAWGLSGFQQEKVGIAQDGCQRIVHARAHFQHVTPQRCLSLRRKCQPLGSLSPADGFDTPQRFDRNKDQGARPAVLPRNDQQMRVFCVEGGNVPFLFGEKNGRRAGGAAYRSKNRRRVSIRHRSDDDQIVVRSTCGMPDAARDERDFRNMPLRLPACRQRTREIWVVRDNHDARGTQGFYNSFAWFKIEESLLLQCMRAGAWY